LRIVNKVLTTSVLILLCVFFLTASVPSVPTGTWQSWNPMGDVRSGAAAVLLQDGRVLISGGSNASGPTASADLFDTNGAFTAITPMNSARSGHTATLLGDGRVLVSGGDTGSGITNSAEVFDPATGSWTLLSATLLDARAGHTASLLSDGRVLFAGGHNSGGALSTLEIFDPLNDDFTSAGTLTANRMNHAAAVLGDGRVLVIGGTADGTNALATVDIYDPVTRTVGVGPTLSTPRMSATATTTLDGKVAVIGGSNGSQDLASAEIFDPATGQITLSASNLATPRSGHNAFLLPDNNSILIVGGTSGGTDLNSAELYFPWTDSFQTTGAMSTARPGMTGSALGQDGRFLAAGGTNLASTELYGFASVKTDKNDYAPGEVVTITGSGWQPGETVALTLIESPLLDTHPPMTAVADANGNIVNTQFSPDEHDLNIRFYLTAVGSQTMAQNTFTDAVSFTNITVGAQTPSAIHSGNSATYNPVTLTFSGNGSTGCTVTLSVTGLPAGASFTFGTNPLTSTGSNAMTTLSINTTGATPTGTFPLTIQGIAPNVAGGQGCNGATRTTSATLVVDNTPPTVTINQAAGQADPTKNSPINFTVVFSEPVADFATGDVTVGGTAGATTATVTGSGTTYSVAVSGMTTDGTVIASIAAGVAHDTAGNPNTASTSTDNTVTYDATAPAPPSTPDMTPGTDSGSLNTDSITSVKKPTFTGTETESGTTVTLLVDGVANGTTTTAGGTWSITAASNIADGDHTVTATATDTAGNVSNPSGPLSIRIDSAANAPSTPDLDPASDSGSLNTDNNTNVTTPKFNGTAEKDATVELFRGGTTSLGTTTADNTGNWSLTLAAALVDGPYNITAKQTDVAGNVSAASGALSITIDTLAPAAPSSPNLAAASDSGVLNTDNITNVTTNLSFSGTAEANSTVTIFEGAVQVGSGSVNNGGNWNNVTADGPFADGPHVFTAKATDAAGNPSLASAPHTVTIDTVRPSVTINQAAGQADPAAAGPIHFTVVFNEAISGFATGDVTLSGTAGATTATVTPVNSTTFDVSVTGMTQAGTVFAAINQNVATDTAGNNNTASTSTDNSVTYNPDSKAPVVTINFTAVDGLNGWYRHSLVLGTVSANDTTTGNSNVTVINCTEDGNTLTVDSPSGIGTPTASGSLSVSGDGTHYISCTATDSAGNSGAFTGSTTMPVVIKIDATAPSLTATRLTPVNANGWNNTNVGVEFTCTDSTSLVASIDATGAATGGSTASPLDVTVTSEGASQSVNGSCKDNAGNSATSASVIDIRIDKTKPVITGGRTPAANAQGWNNTDVTVNFTCADSGSVQSGLNTNTVEGQTLTAEVMNASVTNTGSCVDKAGNTADSAPVSDINIDKTAPNPPTAARTPAANLAGWNNADVTVSFTSNGDTGAVQSGVETCTTSSSLTAETNGTDVNGTCTDIAGNVSSAAMVSVKIDKTKPLITGSRNPAPNAFGWNNVNVTVGFSCGDSGSVQSGIAMDSVAGAAVTTDGPSQSVTNTGSCVDNAGNAADSYAVNNINIDKTPPSVSGTPDRLADHADWYNDTLTVTWTGSDALSGIDTCDAATHYSAPDSPSASVSGHCKDKAGNEGSNNFTFKFDSTPPTAILAVTAGTLGSNGWYTSDVTVHTSGSDTVSNPTICTADQFQTAETTGTEFHGQCTNDAGLSANATLITIKLDKTPPTGVTLTPSGTLGLNNWYTSNVIIHTSGADTISSPTICTGDQAQTTDTAEKTFHGSCTNNAGLSANATDITIKRDATPPTVTPGTPPAGSPYLLNQAVTPTFTCFDNLSGFAPSGSNSTSGRNTTDCTGPATVDTSTIGLHSYGPMVATDQAGNVSVPVTTSYNITYNFVGFLQPIDNLPVINTANAGRTIPVKWQLKDANGVLISDLSSLTSLSAAPIGCSAAPAAIVEEQLNSPGSTVFRFDGAQFIFNWQTTKSWSGCWLLQSTFNDGTVHYARFQFK
jgi:hypothetical protein